MLKHRNSLQKSLYALSSYALTLQLRILEAVLASGQHDQHRPVGPELVHQALVRGDQQPDPGVLVRVGQAPHQLREGLKRASWLRTNGVDTNGAAAKVMNFDRLGKKVRPGILGEIKVCSQKVRQTT